MKLNQDKCHLLILGFKYKNVWTKIEKTKIWEKKKYKLLGADIDRTLSFDEYNASLCRIWLIKYDCKYDLLKPFSSLNKRNNDNNNNVIIIIIDFTWLEW